MGREITETTAHPQLLSGCREDPLRKMNGVWKVARRTIVLHANVLLDETSASSFMGQSLISVMPLTAKRGSRKSITTAGKCRSQYPSGIMIAGVCLKS